MLYSGRVWDGLGILLGAFGRLLIAFWTFKIKLVFSIGPRWAAKGLLARFWVDLGKVLKRVWADLDGFGRVWGGLWKDFKSFE